MSAQKYANFPERELKVVLGPHINAIAMKLLGKLSIGCYEMSVSQQEKVGASSESARFALATLARELKLAVAQKESRDFLSALEATDASHKFQLWVTPPFESGQTSHLVWCKYTDLTTARKVGVSFKIATAFSSDDILVLLKAAQKNAVDLKDDEPFVLKGNPPPRFAKKTPAADADKPAAAPPANPA